VRQKRQKAKTDITFFKAFAVLGGILAVLAIIYGVYSGYVAEMSLINAVGGAIVGLLVLPYIIGAGLMGLKKTIGWCWRTTIIIIPFTLLAAIILLVLSLFILAIGWTIGLFITPIILYRARNLLRDTAWVETLAPSYTYAPPPTAPTVSTNANFCIHCGKPLVPESKFCIHCGKQI
jgi:hypothetical protein